MKTLILMCCMGAVLGGCATAKPGDIKTAVYRDGFRAVQITKIPPDWTGAGKEIMSDCPWSQLAKSSIDGQYYCPIDGSVEGLKTQRNPMVITGNYASMVIPAVGQAASGAFMGLGFGLGLANMPTSTLTQSNAVAGSTVRTSTLLINAPVPGGVAP